MNIAFDEAKNAINFSKHGVTLADAALLEWDTLWVRTDQRHDYGEVRHIGIGYIGLRLYCVVFTDRGEDRRIISLRKANLREAAGYAKA